MFYNKVVSNKVVSKIIQISESSKIICMISIGKLKEGVKTQLSLHLPNIENFKILNSYAK